MESCKHCQPQSLNNLFDFMTDDSDITGEQSDGWKGVPVITRGNLLEVKYFDAFYGEMTKRFKINYCPMCGKKLPKETRWYE